MVNEIFTFAYCLKEMVVMQNNISAQNNSIKFDFEKDMDFESSEVQLVEIKLDSNAMWYVNRC
jgi:hypothetical protein